MGLLSRHKSGSKTPPKAPAPPGASPADFLEFSKQDSASPDSLSPEGSCDSPGRPSGAKRELLVSASFVMIAAGRPDGLAKLYDAVARDLFGYVRSIVGPSDDAEDVLQEVFTKLVLQGPRLLAVRKPVPYLFTMARNEAYKHLRTRSRQAHVSLDGLLVAPAADGAPQVRLTPEEVQDALASLPPEQAEVVVLKIYEGFTFEAIASITGVSPNTAASRYRYGCDKLARRLHRATGSKLR